MDKFFVTGCVKTRKKLSLTPFLSFLDFKKNDSCKIVCFRSRKALEKHVHVIKNCVQSEATFLKNNKIFSDWWNIGNQIFVEPSELGYYDTSYARIYCAKYTFPYGQFEQCELPDNYGVDIFFSTLYPVFFNRFPRLLSSRPKKCTFFCFNLKKVLFIPTNARHKILSLPVLRKNEFNFLNV